MNLFAISACLAGCAVLVLVFRILKNRPRGTKLAVLTIFGVLSVPFVLFSFYYLHVLPESAWFYEFRSRPGVEFFAVFAAVATGAAVSLLPRSLGLIPFSAYCLLATAPYLKPGLRPLDWLSYRERWKAGVCLQSTPATCGPASVCTILKYLRPDKNFRESDAARGSFSSASGTEAWYLARWVREQGFRASFDFDPAGQFSPDRPLPALVGVREGSWGHFIAVLSQNPDGTVTFADPLLGGESLPLAIFQKQYEFTGFRMPISLN